MLEHLPIEGIPGTHGSLWEYTSKQTDFPSLSGTPSFDVAIIGGGITGLTCAYRLKQAGYTVAVLEKDRIGQGTTGHTTAKVTSAHGIVYQPLIKHFGKDLAKIYADANQWAIQWMGDLVRSRNIDCDFTPMNAYIYAETDQERGEVESEMKAAESLGLPVFFSDTPDLPFATKGAVGFRDQALFHPRKYLLGLLDAIQGDGSFIYENTMAGQVNEGNPCEVVTDHGTVKAQHVIVATMYPFLMAGAFYTKLFPKQSYVMAATINGNLPDGMFYSAGDYGTTIRPHPFKEGPVLIFGGDVNKVGQGGDIVERYRTLEKKFRSAFDIRSLEYYWTTQDALSMDGVPYIGKISTRSRSIYVATGFKQWGLTHGTVAAQILSDMIQGKDNPWLKLYDATRLKPSASIKEFAMENANVGKELVKGLLSRPPHDLGQLANDTAALVQQDNAQIGVYKDEKGQVFSVGRTCTHLGCQVNWDNAERSWDCPCHGSRFDHTGNVEYGPAAKNLEQKEVKEEVPAG